MGIHRFRMYYLLHLERFRLMLADHNMWLLFTTELFYNADDPLALTVLQTVGTVTECIRAFLKLHPNLAQKFECERQQFVKVSQPFLCIGNGIKISPGSIETDDCFHVMRFAMIKINPVGFHKYITSRPCLYWFNIRSRSFRLQFNGSRIRFDQHEAYQSF